MTLLELNKLHSTHSPSPGHNRTRGIRVDYLPRESPIGPEKEQGAQGHPENWGRVESGAAQTEIMVGPSREAKAAPFEGPTGGHSLRLEAVQKVQEGKGRCSRGGGRERGTEWGWKGSLEPAVAPDKGIVIGPKH